MQNFLKIRLCLAELYKHVQGYTFFSDTVYISSLQKICYRLNTKKMQKGVSNQCLLTAHGLLVLLAQIPTIPVTIVYIEILITHNLTAVVIIICERI